MGNRINLSFGLPVVLATASALSASGAAQAEEAVRSSQRLEEVVVTAQRVTENLQRVPVAVTAFSEDDLRDRDVKTFADLSGIAAGLTVSASAPSGGNIGRMSMRGQYQRSSLATADPSVGIYVDEVYWARAYGVLSDLHDVQRAEVLKGPQGTLFGRNTTGGAILITTNDPSLDGIGGEASVTLGNYGLMRGEAVLNAPLSDRVAVRAAFRAIESDGFIKDHEHPSAKYGEQGSYSGRLKLLADINDKMSLVLSADLYNEDIAPDNGQLRYVTTTSFTNLQAGIQLLGPANCFADTGACFGAGRSSLNSFIDLYEDNPDDVAYSLVPFSETETQTYTGKFTYALPFGEAKLIAGYRDVEMDSVGDYDGAPVNGAGFSIFQDLDQWSVEGQLAGDLIDGRMSFVTGVFYFEEDGSDSTGFDALPGLSPTLTKYSGVIDNKSLGIYGQVNYDLTNSLSVTAGIRWTKDDKAVTINNGVYLGTLLTETPGTFECRVSTGCPSRLSGDFSGESYTAGIEYQATDDVMVYAKYSSSFRSGGVNLRQTTAIPGVPEEPFEPEDADSYEVGVKSEFFDNRARFNLSAYYMDVTDLQREFIISDGITSATVAGNAGEAEFKGGEAELSVLAFDNGGTSLTLYANTAYLKPKYVEYVNPVTGFDRSREKFDWVPKWQFSVSGTLTHRLNAGTITAFAAYKWDDGYAMDDFNYYIDEDGVARDASDGAPLPLVDAENLERVLYKNEGGQLDLRAAFRFGEDERYEVAAFGQNVLDNRQYNNSNAVIALAISSLRRPPATWGVSLTADF